MTDRYLQRALKNWAVQQQPPKNTRARLLLNASARSYFVEETQGYVFEEHHSKSTDPYSLQGNEPARIMDLLRMLHMPSPELRMI